jgi:hypothetical protein
MPAVDIESRERQPLVNNQYAANSPGQDLLNKLYRAVVLAGSLYYLHTLELYATVLKSRHVQHEWFKIGLAASVGEWHLCLFDSSIMLTDPKLLAMLFVKFYVEIFAGKLQRRTVNYTNFRHETHAMLLLMLLSTVAFHLSLWPAYGSKTLVIMTVIGYGVLLQFTLLVPTQVQNAVGFIAMTFFLQEYA